MMADLRVSPDGRRFELDLGGGTAFASGATENGVITIRHTEVPAKLRGRGFGDQLMHAMFANARAHGLRVRPLCGFAAGFMDRHPEYDDVRA